MAVFFSARLDETGTDGRSPYAMVAGGVSAVDLWDKLESRWNHLLRSRRVTAYHWSDFNQRKAPFDGWGDLKRRNFQKAQEKIINKTVAIQIAVAVHRETHANVKKRWAGVRNFKADSDCGLCFRVARHLICKKLVEFHANGTIPTKPNVQFIVEDGPYAADAYTIYQETVATIGTKYKPTQYAEMLAGFGSLPKGQLRSLEAADYIAGRAIADLERGTFIEPGRTEQISMLMTPDFLEDWNDRMVKERTRRQEYARRIK
jgi:hypothetical protein